MPLHRSLKAMLKLCLSLLVLQTLTTVVQSRIAKPGCPDYCGNVSVPYPFGLKEGCYLNSSKSFFLNCSHNETLFFSPNSATYGFDQFRVTEISMDGYLNVRTPILTACNNESINKSIITSPEFPFDIGNNFIVVGCDTFGIIATSGHSTGCSTFCIDDTDFSQVSPCTGTGCCQTPYISDESAMGMGSMWNYTIQLRRVTNHTEMGGKEYPCSSAFLSIDYPSNKFTESELNTIGNRDDITAIINWAVGNESCSEAKSKVSYACKAKHSRCEDAQNPTGYRCICKYKDIYPSYNPYVEDGCPGPWTSCLIFLGGRIEISIFLFVVCRTSLGILMCALYYLGKGIRKKLLKKRKKKLFRQNGGHLLQDSLPIFQGATNPIRMFTIEEMEMATNRFDNKNIIGRGGFGIVYKGYLLEVGALAVKKSKMLDQTEIKQFINEVVLLSKIHHKNVVTFLGCCLEMDVPLLVYEFVSNGTLKSHLHSERNQLIMPWITRLKVATETAGVLAYLQNNHRPPVIHRDVKPDNILLDENFNTKVSDFGLSRLVSQNESHMHTKVQGTFGYLDPEYFRTSELTEKSDVYSLGVVLVELITRKKLLTDKYSILVEKFGFSMRDNTVCRIIDQDIVNEENVGEILEVAKVANMCLRDKGEERPTMDEVAMHLKSIWAEVEHKQRATKSYNLEENEDLISRGCLDTHATRPNSSGSHMSSWYLSGGR